MLLLYFYIILCTIVIRIKMPFVLSGHKGTARLDTNACAHCVSLLSPLGLCSCAAVPLHTPRGQLQHSCEQVQFDERQKTSSSSVSGGAPLPPLWPLTLWVWWFFTVMTQRATFRFMCLCVWFYWPCVTLQRPCWSFKARWPSFGLSFWISSRMSEALAEDKTFFAVCLSQCEPTVAAEQLAACWQSVNELIHQRGNGSKNAKRLNIFRSNLCLSICLSGSGFTNLRTVVWLDSGPNCNTILQ